mmetsp:Transcript_30823/g.55413  ORF Transcript_30823/g.55413 Transcript_30823/m.55413 type:complete len:146 (-) Transcript_30823:530-967(-)
MTTVYFINLLSWLNAIVQMVMHQSGYEDYALQVYKLSRIGGPLVSILCLLPMLLGLHADIRYLLPSVGLGAVLLLFLPLVWGAKKTLWRTDRARRVAQSSVEESELLSIGQASIEDREFSMGLEEESTETSAAVCPTPKAPTIQR